MAAGPWPSLTSVDSSLPRRVRLLTPWYRSEYSLGDSSGEEDEPSPAPDCGTCLSREVRSAPSAASRASHRPSSHIDTSKFDHMATEATGQSRSSLDRNVTRTNMQKFALSRREASAWVRRGELLMKHPVSHPDAGRFSSLREMRRKPQALFERAKKFHFVVLDRHKTASGHPELRWDSDPAVAESKRAKGCLVLSDIHYVAATVLEDEPEDRRVSEKLLREFQIVCPGYTLKIVAPSRESMKLWVVGLLQLSRLAKKRNVKFTRTTVDEVLWNTIVREFTKLDQDHSGDISQTELANMIQTVGGNPEIVRQVLTEFDADGNGVLQLQEFAQLFQAFAVKEVLTPWFREYACPVTTDQGMQTLGISEVRFLDFLRTHQGETASQGAVFANMQDPHVVLADGKPHVTELGFSHLLCSSSNPAFDPSRRHKVYMDMTQPLSHYWISSSHNTYLQSDQLFGKSALEQYIEVLLRGCRCVEIDCWDGEDGEPIVTHGYTATSRLMFEDVVRVCRDYGFVASPYPLILSLEVHCGRKQLARMGQILNDILGEQLLRLPQGGLPAADLVSPAGAMRKVIVKGKVPQEALVEEYFETSVSTSSTAAPDVVGYHHTMSASSCRGFLKSLKRWSRTLSSLRSRSSSQQPEAELDEALEIPERDTSFSGSLTLPWSEWPTASQDTFRAKESVRSGKSLAPTKASKESTTTRRLLRQFARGKEALSEVDLMAVQEYARTLYLVSRKPPKQGLLEDISPELFPCNIVSFSEKKAGELLEQSPSLVRNHHRRNLSRVYPRATRTSSSNFDPVPFWLAGVQMVALNYQSMDLPVLLNEGLFRNGNGGAGYILKPDLAPSSCPCRLEVGVLCGQYLPKPASGSLGGMTNPMVRVSICGLQEDRQTRVTRQILDNGFNPRWGEVLAFDISHPSLSMLVFEVVHSAACAKPKLKEKSTPKLGLGAPKKKRSLAGRKACLRRCMVSCLGRSKKQKPMPSLWAAEEVVAAAAMPLNGLREGLRWVQLLDARFHAVERSGLLLQIKLQGPWVQERTLSAGSFAAAPVPTGSSRTPLPATFSADEEMIQDADMVFSI